MSEPRPPVFFDPGGKRSAIARILGRGFLLLVSVLATLFVVSLFAIPVLRPLPREAKRKGRVESDRTDVKRLAAASAKHELAKLASFEPKTIPVRPSSSIVAGYYTPWQDTSLQSLRTNAGHLTHLIPEWLHLTADGQLDDEDASISQWPKNREIMPLARANGLIVLPILSNGKNGKFDVNPVRPLLQDAKKAQAFADHLATWLIDRRCQGIHLDIENLTGVDYERLPAFFATISRTLHEKGLVVSAALEAANEDVPLRKLADLCDFVVFMAYDEHAEDSDAGPIASIDWVTNQTEIALQSIPADKLVLGVGSYAYDWTAGALPAASLTFQEAMSTAEGYRESEDSPDDVINIDPVSLNAHFAYDDENDVRHKVWMLDAVGAYNAWSVGRQLHLRGAALWALGSEDPGVWAFLDRNRLNVPIQAHQLDAIALPYDVDYRGRGEILSVSSTPKQGQRSIDLETASGLITDETYHRFPAPYVLDRRGYLPKALDITFDDGPDPAYTPQILAALRELEVPATFFVIGSQVEENPSLIRQMVAEGHEIGSHTFTHPNLGASSDERVELELNATQRAIQGITGRSTVMFRPPFNADSTPTTSEELRPVAIAGHLGYITVGENIDPNDWDLETLTGPAKSAQIVRTILDGVAHGDGNVILLHDGGGDRTATIAALRQVVPILTKKGYRFVRTSELMGLRTADVMPYLSARELLIVGLDRFVFSTVFTGQSWLAKAFVLAIILGLLRVALMVPLALRHYWTSRRFLPFETPPTVSVLIAAYNEETVIARTVSSILANDSPVQEVIVIDDGSLDRTSEVIQTAFADEPRVKLIAQKNGGKASALNAGLAIATGEVFVCVDADTILSPDAIRKLSRHFADPKMGAVAGNVRVGNADNLLTTWQSIEYTTSQNLDRRAYAVLNCVTVVPGAIGAWRASAIRSAGGYSSDTLAEDMDLTWRIRMADWRIATEGDAMAFTEAPDGIKPFFKQRFRWAYGTLQALWKHRRALGRFGFFGCFALPSLWLFQIVFQAIAPLVDLQLLISLVTFITALTTSTSTQELSPLPEATRTLIQIGFLYGLFFLAELASGIVAYRMERRPIWPLGWLFVQRFVYRQIMYGVIFKSFAVALNGARTGWGKLDRKNTARSD
jgi:peptidoglycan-N-acetylglucosamine deacetylase